MIPIQVVVGVIRGPKGVFISQRRPDQTYPGYWEFPGGKVEEGESYLAALQRELLEEIGIIVPTANEMLCIERVLHDKILHLHAFLVYTYTGIPKGCEGQAVQWADLAMLQALPFPSSNAVIIEQLHDLL